MEHGYRIFWEAALRSEAEDSSQPQVKGDEVTSLSLMVTMKSLALASHSKTKAGQRSYVGNHLAKYTPRTVHNEKRKYLQRVFLEILMSLDAIGLDILKKEFQKAPDGELSLVEFVEVIFRCTRALSFNHDIDLVVEALIELFDSMDLDGNAALEFEELLETIIHWGLTAGGGASTKMVLEDPISAFVVGPRQRLSHRVTQRKIQYAESIDRILVHEPMRRKIKLIDPDTLKIVKCVDLDSRDITCIEYVHMDSTGWQCKLVIAAASQKIQIWEGLMGNKFLLQETIETRMEASCVKYLRELDLIVAGSRNGNVYSWKVKSGCLPGLTLKGHKSSILCLCTVDGTNQVVTGSMDRTLRLWDYKKGIERYLYEGHNKAVNCVVYSKQSGLLLSGSLDTTICIWSTTDRHMLFRLEQHKYPIVFLAFHEGTPQCVSGDSSGEFRIWDTRLSFACVQALISSQKIDSAAYCVRREARLIYPTPTEVLSFDQPSTEISKMRKRRPTQGGHDWLVASSYNPNGLVFVTSTCNQVRFWNALTGCLKEIYENLMEGDITAMCFDHNQRKMILGDSKGHIHVFNAMSGGLMKSMESHDAEIMGLQYVTEYRLVVSLSIDGVLKTHDEKPINNCPVRLQIDVHEKKIREPTCFACSFPLSLCAVADVSGVIGMWDLEAGFMAEHYTFHLTTVTCIQFLNDWPVIVSADEKGFVHFWYIRPSPFHGEIIYQFQNVDSDSNPCGITSMDYDDHHKTLFTGDISGRIIGWDLSHLLRFSCNNVRVNVPFEPGRMRVSQFRALQTKNLVDYRSNRDNALKRCQSSQYFGSMDVLMKSCFACSDNYIAKIGFIPDPQALYVQTWGPRLHIWSMHGKLLGEVGMLDHARYSTQFYSWKFSINTKQLNTDSQQMINSVMQDLSKKTMRLLEKAQSKFEANRNQEIYEGKRRNPTNDEDSDDEKKSKNYMRLRQSASLKFLPSPFYDVKRKFISRLDRPALAEERRELRRSGSKALDHSSISRFPRFRTQKERNTVHSEHLRKFKAAVRRTMYISKSVSAFALLERLQRPSRKEDTYVEQQTLQNVTKKKRRRKLLHRSSTRLESALKNFELN